MDDSFGQLLRECRMETNLTQKELGQKIHLDGSMISRFEKERASPNQSTLQAIINALALYDIPREKLDQLWEAAGYYRTQVFEKPVADPVVAFIQQELEELDSAERKLLSQELRSVVEIAQAYLSAKKAGRQRKWDQAGEDLLSLRELLEQRFQGWYLRIDEEVGLSRHSVGRYAQAVQYYEQALWSAIQLNESHKQAEIHIKLGDAYRRLGGIDWDTAHKCYRVAKEILEKQGDRIRVADCLRKIAGTYLFQGLPKDAEPWYKESLTICQDKGYDKGVYKALQHQAWAYDMLGQWEEATQLYEVALAIVKRVTSDDWEIAKALLYLGDAYRVQRKFDEAERAYAESLGIAEEFEKTGVDTRLLLSMIQLGLGQVALKRMGGQIKAKHYLRESQKLLQAGGEPLKVARVLSEQGDLLLQLGRFDEAEMRLLQASDRFKKLGNIFYYAIPLVTLCELYYQKRDLDRIYHTAEAARKADNSLIDYQLARIEFTVGKAHIDEGRYSEAFDAFCVASEKALSFNDKTFRELCDDMFNEVDRIARGIAPEMALQLCESNIRFWENKKVASAKQGLVRESLEGIRQKQEETRALTPIA